MPKINDLPQVENLSQNAYIPVTQDGTTYKASVDKVSKFSDIVPSILIKEQEDINLAMAEDGWYIGSRFANVSIDGTEDTKIEALIPLNFIVTSYPDASKKEVVFYGAISLAEHGAFSTAFLEIYLETPIRYEIDGLPITEGQAYLLQEE